MQVKLKILLEKSLLNFIINLYTQYKSKIIDDLNLLFSENSMILSLAIVYNACIIVIS